MKPAIFLTLIISLAFTKANAQNLEQTFDFANSLFENKKYESAVEAYRRILFFDQENLYSPLIYKNIAESLYETGKPEEAAYYYELAYFSTENDTIKTELTLKRISCFLILKQPQYAQVELFNLPETLDSETRNLVTFYEALVYFAQGEYAQSETAFKSIATDTLVIESLFNKNAKIDRLNPKTAKVLSIIMPGLGQFYAGDVKNGINSLVLSGGLFFLGIRSAINNSLLDATISVLPWFQRYYTGGFKKAEVIAEAKIKERRYKVYNELLDQFE